MGGYLEGIITGMGLSLLMATLASRATLRRIESDELRRDWTWTLVTGAGLLLLGCGLFLLR